MDINFRKFTKEDIPLYYQWAEKPYVKDIWFKEGYEPKERIVEKIGGSDVMPFVITVGDKSIGYIQYYDLSKDCWKDLENEPEGTFGFDVFIGEEDYLDKGYGTELVIKFTDMISNLDGVKKIIVDPEPDNKRAIRCYEKAGFSFTRKGVDDIGGEIYIMEKLVPRKFGGYWGGKCWIAEDFDETPDEIISLFYGDDELLK